MVQTVGSLCSPIGHEYSMCFKASLKMQFILNLNAWPAYSSYLSQTTLYGNILQAIEFAIIGIISNGIIWSKKIRSFLAERWKSIYHRQNITRVLRDKKGSTHHCENIYSILRYVSKCFYRWKCVCVYLYRTWSWCLRLWFRYSAQRYTQIYITCTQITFIGI